MPNDRAAHPARARGWRITGKPLSALQRGARPALPFAVKGIRAAARARGAARAHRERFDAMLRRGLVDEVQGAAASSYRLHADMPSMRAVGYRQVWQFLEGEIDEAALREQAVAATRQLAKRQLTWLRSFPGLEPAARRPYSGLMPLRRMRR